MSVPDWLKQAARTAKYVILISMCYLKIKFYAVSKLVIFWIWRFATSFKNYGMEHANELIYQLIITILGGIIAGYIVYG